MGKRKPEKRPTGLAGTITIGVDGRLYWHEVTPAMLEVAAALCANDPALRCRLAAAFGNEGLHHEHNADRA